MNRATLLENMELVVSYASKKQEEKALGQVNLFDMGEVKETTEDMLSLNEVSDFEDKDVEEQYNELTQQDLIELAAGGDEDADRELQERAADRDY